MKRILVTGGTGFIGSNLSLRLSSDGYDVRILRRENSNLLALQGVQVEHCIGDVMDKASVARAMEGCDTVFHTAGVVSFWKKEIRRIYDVNVIGTRNVAEVALDLGVERFVHTSSIASLGFRRDGKPADETTEFNWLSFDIPYKNSKYQGEQEILKAVAKGLPAVIVNPTVVIGPRDVSFHGGGLIREVRKGLTLFYLDSWINVVYVGDVVAGHISAATKGRIGERYILGGENLKTKEAFHRIAEIVNGQTPKIKLPFTLAKIAAWIIEVAGTLWGVKPVVTLHLITSAQYSNPYSMEKAITGLEYHITPFEVAVREAYEWYLRNKMI